MEGHIVHGPGFGRQGIENLRAPALAVHKVMRKHHLVGVGTGEGRIQAQQIVQVGGAAAPETQYENGGRDRLGGRDLRTVAGLLEEGQIGVPGGQRREQGQPGEVAPMHPQTLASQDGAQGLQVHPQDELLK